MGPHQSNHPTIQPQWRSRPPFLTGERERSWMFGWRWGVGSQQKKNDPFRWWLVRICWMERIFNNNQKTWDGFFENVGKTIPIPSMYDDLTYIWLMFMVICRYVGKSPAPQLVQPAIQQFQMAHGSQLHGPNNQCTCSNHSWIWRELFWVYRCTPSKTNMTLENSHFQ